MNKIIKAEIKKFADSFEHWDSFSGKTVLVTGASGLIGHLIVFALLCANEFKKTKEPIKIVACARNKKKLENLFGEFGFCNLEFLVSDIREKIIFKSDVDFAIHCAMNTKSKSFVETPVETIEIGLGGTKNFLEFAKEKKCESAVFLSSMEVYGFGTEEKLLSEDLQGYINPLDVRSSYPMAKRMAETLCAAYSSQYKIPVKIIRLAQVFGVGAHEDDTRVFAEFARSAICQKDIVLKTSGKSARMYLYDIDAVAAIFTVLIKGQNAQAYNVANKRTYCSIEEMAQIVAQKIAGGKIKVVFAKKSKNVKEYSSEHKFFLDTKKIESLGWSATNGLQEMYAKMIEKIDGGGVLSARPQMDFGHRQNRISWLARHN